MTDHDYFIERSRETDQAIEGVRAYGAGIEDGREGDLSLALMISTDAIVAVLREMGVRIEIAIRDSAKGKS